MESSSSTTQHLEESVYVVGGYHRICSEDWPKMGSQFTQVENQRIFGYWALQDELDYAAKQIKQIQCQQAAKVVKILTEASLSKMQEDHFRL